MIKQAIILAAGSGKRMKNGSSDAKILNTPKPLLEVFGTPIIARQIRLLSYWGVKVSVVINPEDEAKFRHELDQFPVTYIYQNERLGTANALQSAASYVEEDLFLVLMGDDINNYKLGKLLEVNSPVIFGYETNDVSHYGVISTDEDGFVTRIMEKQLTGRGVANCGVYVMPKEYFRLSIGLKPHDVNGEYYLTDIVEMLYRSGRPMKLSVMDYWRGVNTLEDLKEANTFHDIDVYLREPSEDDLFQLLPLLEELSPRENIGTPPPISEMRGRLGNMIEDKNGMTIVAEYNSEIVGTATLVVQDNLTHEGRPIGHIENVVTKQGFRGRGIGKILIEKLKEIGRKKGCYKIVLSCRQDNVQFYEKSGFRKSGEVEMRLDL